MDLKIRLFGLFLILFVWAEENCRERNRPVTSDKEDLYEILDVKPGEKLILQCHYCNEKDDSRPRNWYKADKLGLNESHEVQLSMENEADLNRIWVNTEHSLIINNFSGSDVGLYSCSSLGQQNKDEKFNYLVDLVYDDNLTEIESGNLSSWSNYHSDFFLPINKLLWESKGEEFSYIRERLKLTLEVITQWGPWGVCEVCGRTVGDGRKKRRGHCRLKLTPNSGENTTDKPEEMYFLRANAISCRSIRLGELFPGISNLTRVVPDFILEEKCEGTCNPDAEGAMAGWKVGKTKGFKYRKTFVLAEKSHLTLICPESSLDNTVTWKKRGKVLKSGDASDSHLLIDTFNTLYLMDVTSTEAGNYTCQVDDIQMQQVIIFVVSHSRLLTQELARHMMYLAFILSLTCTCYCAGLIITCNRRRNFKSYGELIKDHPGDLDEFEGLL